MSEGNAQTKPTQEEIDAWKKQYGRVQKLTIAGVDYYYRPVALDEYLNIQRLIGSDEELSGEVETVKVGLLSPELPENPPAGVVLKISDEVLRMSGFDIQNEPEEL